ncbi:hypothetical protein VMCG_06133 [Cytospora schulzeri]|uniref:Uncharacterized protein n=1 Tax=Cytospora schulzeri TaxID=448051 RepID=A0A423WGP8_9PEZI|nr:hypothetical protein VMCG_06133 [Valsa malicola]
MDRTGCFTRLISSGEGKKPAPSNIVTFGGGGGGERKHPSKDETMLTIAETSTERLRGQPEPHTE